MTFLASFSLRNRSLITLLALVASVFGVLSFTSMRQDLVPAVASAEVSIVTPYDGAAPAVVDSEVSQVVETIVESVDGLVSTTTYSGTDLSLVTASFDLGLDTAEIVEQISTKLAENSALLPDDLKPQVSAASVDDFPVMQFAVSPGDTPFTTTLQDAISQRIEGLDGVREARFVGVAPDQMRVQLDESRSEETGIGVRDLRAAILSGGLVEASGSLTEGDQTLAVQNGTAVASAEDIAALPVVAPATGETLTVGDVALVRQMVAGASVVARVDGEPTVVLLVSKIPNANAVELSRGVREEMTVLDRQYGLDSTVVFDQSPYIERSIETLTTEGLIGLLCAVAVVLFFLASVRTTLVTAVSIPTSLLLAGIAMNAVGYSVNMITLAALTVAIGRVVDDSIVVVESIEREMLDSSDRVAAIMKGVSSVTGAVISSTLTTVAVFLPIAYISGTLGELFRPFALTAAAAILASLVVSLTIVPVLTFWFVRPRIGVPGTARFDERVRSRLDQLYRPLLRWSLEHRGRVVAFSVAVLGATAALIPGLSIGYLAPLGDTQIRVLQKLDPAASIDAQKNSAEIVEDELRGVDGVERVQTSLRSSGSVLEDAALGGGGGITSYLLSTTDGVDQTALIDTVRDRLESREDADTLGELDYSVTSDMEFSPGIEISVTALDDASLAEAVGTVMERIEGLDTVADAESSLASTVERIDVDVDGAKAVEYGLTDQDVRDAVADALTMTKAGDLIVAGDSIQILVLPEHEITTTNALADIAITTPTDGDMPLSTFASVEKARGPVVVQSQQGLRAAIVSVSPRTDDLGATSDALAGALDDVALPEGAAVRLGGAVTARVDAFEQMGVISLIAVLMVYAIMVATFRSLLQPALLLVAIPFAGTGGLIVQRVTGEPFGVPSLIGCLMLVGIVVTNSIVLVDLVNQRRAEGVPLRDAVLEGATRRARPIIMTAAATVFALLPMALGLTSSSAFISRPLALVVIGGLASSTILTLIVLPVLYSLLADSRRSRSGRAHSGDGEVASDEEGAVSHPPYVHAAATTPRRARTVAVRRVRRPRAPVGPARAGTLETLDRRAEPVPAPDLERTTRLVPAGSSPAPTRPGAVRPLITRTLDDEEPLTPSSPWLVDGSTPRGDRTGAHAHPSSRALPQYVTFEQEEERTRAATVRTWWTTSTSGRLPLLMLDPFTPHGTRGVGIAEPVHFLEFSGRRLSLEQFQMLRSLTAVLRGDLHGYAYFAAQLVLWEILGPDAGPDLDVRIPPSDAENVSREFEALYESILHARPGAPDALWVVTPTSAAEPRMLVGGV
ncbi:efflux RND transporter permease subunit [Labedella populi]|nr:efflux RND transporter permease subunit [Labedella populi]